MESLLTYDIDTLRQYIEHSATIEELKQFYMFLKECIKRCNSYGGRRLFIHEFLKEIKLITRKELISRLN